MGYAIAILILFAAAVDLFDAFCLIIYFIFTGIRSLINICRGKNKKVRTYTK